MAFARLEFDIPSVARPKADFSWKVSKRKKANNREKVSRDTFRHDVTFKS